MIRNIFASLFYFVVFILIQVWILNNIHLFRIATPFIYLYFILKLPVNTSRSRVILLSFLTGLVMDAFSNTPGMHAAACTLLGLARAPIIHLFNGDDFPAGISPSYKTFGFGGFLRYALALTLIHHVCLFIIESFTLFDPLFLVLRIVASVLLSTLLICIVEAFNIVPKYNGESGF